MQKRVKRAVEDLSGLGENDVKWAVDGCNLPAPAMPLKNMALTYARLAEAADFEDTPTSSSHSSTLSSPSSSPPRASVEVLPRTKHLARIFHAMTAYPSLIGGTGRFCTVLAESYHGALLGKIGADACYGISIRSSATTRALGSEGAIGIAVKVEDGNIDILYAAVLEVLKQLGIWSASERPELKRFHERLVLNTMGVETGRFFTGFKLRPVIQVQE
jgi:L-asparaginase II